MLMVVGFCGRRDDLGIVRSSVVDVLFSVGCVIVVAFVSSSSSWGLHGHGGCGVVA